MSTVVGDARSLSTDALVELRRRVVAAVQGGATQAQVATLFGVSRQTVGAWMREYRDRGEGAFLPGRRGRRPGEQLALSSEQQLWVARTVARQPPDEVGLRYLVWTRQAVAELINREFWVMLGVTTVGNYLVRWGFPGAQDLLRNLRGRNAMAVGDPTHAAGPPAWIPGAEVIWVGHNRPEWTIADRAGWPDVSVLHAVSNRGAMYFLACADPFDAGQLCGYLDRLVGQLRRRVNVIVSWQPAKGCGALPDWLAGRAPNAAVRFVGAAPPTR